MKPLIGIVATALVLLFLPPAVGAAPQTDATFLEITTSYTLNPDGSSRFEYHHLLQLHTQQAINRYGESFLLFDPEWQTLTVDRSVTTMADGRQVPTPANGYIDVLPAAVDKAPDYSRLLERVVSHTGLECGATIDLAYHIESRAGFQPWLWGEEIFATPYPVVERQLEVKIPSAIPLHFSGQHATIPLSKREEGGYTVYSWRLDAVAAAPAEESQPPLAEYAPRVLFSTCPGWPELAGWLSSQLESAAADASLPASAVTDTATGSPLDRALSWQRKINDEMLLTSLDQRLTGYRIAALPRIEQRSYGTEWERAALLAARLRREGIAAQVALLSRQREGGSEVALLPIFGQAVVALLAPDGRRHLLPVNNTAGGVVPAEKAGYELFIPGLTRGAPEELQAAENLTAWSGELTMDADGRLEGELELTLSGAAYSWYQMQQEGGASELAQKNADRLLGSCQVKSVLIRALDAGHVTLALQVAKEKALTPLGKAAWLLPALGSQLDEWRIPVYAAQRATPIQLPAAMTERVQVTVRGPQGSRWRVEKEHQAALQTASGRFSAATSAADNLLTIQREVILGRRSIPTDEYSDFRALMARFRQLKGLLVALEQ